MKTFKNLYPQICDWENTIAAYKLTRGTKKSKIAALRFHEHYAENLVHIRESLINETWTPATYSDFTKFNSHKMRSIECPLYADRIVHNALVQVIEPLAERRFITHTYSCLKGRGTHKAVDHLQRIMREAGDGAYVLKCDISRYFPSIRHDVLMNLWRRIVADERTLRLIALASFRPENKTGVGVPIGARPSQLNANVYLDPLDHYVAERLSVGRRYVRYADDFAVIDRDKARLREVLRCIEAFIMPFGLSLNPKTDIFPARHGVDFCGYRVFTTHRLPRKKVLRNFRTYLRNAVHIRNYQRAFMIYASLIGYISHCSAKRSVLRIIPKLRKGLL